MFKLVMYVTMVIAAVVSGILSWRFSNKNLPTAIEGIKIGAFITYLIIYFVAFLVCLFAIRGYAL